MTLTTEDEDDDFVDYTLMFLDHWEIRGNGDDLEAGRIIIRAMQAVYGKYYPSWGYKSECTSGRFFQLAETHEEFKLEAWIDELLAGERPFVMCYEMKKGAGMAWSKGISPGEIFQMWHRFFSGCIFAERRP